MRDYSPPRVGHGNNFFLDLNWNVSAVAHCWGWRLYGGKCYLKYEMQIWDISGPRSTNVNKICQWQTKPVSLSSEKRLYNNGFWRSDPSQTWHLRQTPLRGVCDYKSQGLVWTHPWFVRLPSPAFTASFQRLRVGRSQLLLSKYPSIAAEPNVASTLTVFNMVSGYRVLMYKAADRAT